MLFKKPTVRGDLEVEAHNEWTLCMWAKWMASKKSTHTGRHLKAKTIESRLSLAKGFLSFKYGFQLAGEAPRLRGLLKRWRENDPFGRLRKKRRGLRRRHLQKLWNQHASVRANTQEAKSEWAATTSSWHILLRGGETERLLRSDVQFKTHKRSGRRYAVVWVEPLKKRGGPKPKVPNFIYEQVEPEEWEPYRALRRHYEATSDRPPSAPLFTAAKGKRMTTSRFRALMKRYARMLGWDPKQAGAHSPRIGGASEYVATGEASQLLLEARGRWNGDIAAIYARMTLRMHQAASDMMFAARGRDLEELMPQFVQPA